MATTSPPPPRIPGCHTQARSLDEVIERIREATELCLGVQGAPEENLVDCPSHSVTNTRLASSNSLCDHVTECLN